MFLSRVFSIPVRFFIALLVCFPWELLAGEVVTAPVPEFSSPALIPYPSKVVWGKGGARFKSVHVHLGRDVPRRDDLVREMKDVFRMSGIPAAVSKDVFEEGSLTWELSLDAGIEGEAYVLSVTPEKTTVRAGGFGGFSMPCKRCGSWFPKRRKVFSCRPCRSVTNPPSPCGV